MRLHSLRLFKTLPPPLPKVVFEVPIQFPPIHGGRGGGGLMLDKKPDTELKAKGASAFSLSLSEACWLCLAETG